MRELATLIRTKGWRRGLARWWQLRVDVEPALPEGRVDQYVPSARLHNEAPPSMPGYRRRRRGFRVKTG